MEWQRFPPASSGSIKGAPGSRAPHPSLTDAPVETIGLTLTSQPAADALPLAGRTVAVVHPAWHSCGAYEVYVGQAEAYRALGADVITVACNDQPGYAPGSSWWGEYRRLTPEMESTPRSFAGVSYARFLRPAFFRDVVIPYWRGDGAAMRQGFAERSALSPEAEAAQVDLVHCNHFFCMPVAHRVAKGAPIVIDTIDVQARQFDLINDVSRFVLPPRVGFEAMLAQEIEAMRPAAGLLHINAEERDFFVDRMPGAPHHLLYPAVRDMKGAPGGDTILIVASNNPANVESILWFLREVLPRAGHPPVVIAGNVDGGVRSKDSALYETHRALFAGRVDDLAAVYRKARLVLLPTIAGTGISIKAVEALSTGLPLIASPLAFRGMVLDAGSLRNVTMAPDADAFAAALQVAVAQPHAPTAREIAGSDTRRAYEMLFSKAAYARNLASIVLPLVQA